MPPKRQKQEWEREAFRQNVSLIMRVFGVSVRGLASRMEITDAAVRKAFRHPTNYQAKQFAEALDVPVKWIWARWSPAMDRVLLKKARGKA